MSSHFMTKALTLPLSDDDIKSLQAGDFLRLTGELYTARDAAHKRLHKLIIDGQPLPIELTGKAVYYAGPCPAAPGQVIGSIGPTTSARMDKYSPLLIEQGLKVMIGKGERSNEVVSAIQQNCGVYLAAIGGAGALLAGAVRSSEVMAFEDLGTEAIRRLYVEDFPVIVAIDCRGEKA